jgi:hypothetical protein
MAKQIPNVWKAKCSMCEESGEESCIQLFDHKPTNADLISANFCSEEVEDNDVWIERIRADKLFNRML